MFKAILMICSLAQANDCMQFTDRRGLYKIKEECLARLLTVSRSPRFVIAILISLHKDMDWSKLEHRFFGG